MNHKFKDVEIVNQNDLKNYEIGEAVGFPNYSLVKIRRGYIFIDQ